MNTLRHITESERYKLSWVMYNTTKFMNDEISKQPKPMLIKMSNRKTVFLPEVWAYLWQAIGRMQNTSLLEKYTHFQLFDMIVMDPMMRRIVEKAQLKYYVHQERKELQFRANPECSEACSI